MATINKWRVWSETDSKWLEIWSPTEPVSYFDNSSHVIDRTKTSIIETIEENFPVSEIGKKIWVHNSPKPIIPGKQTYAMWIGCGDDTTNHVIGEGPLLKFNMTIGTPTQTVDAKFDPLFGQVYIHEGYVSWSNAGFGDYISADIVAEPSALQTSINLNLLVDAAGYVSYSPNGPGTGTHGFAATPQLLPRTFSHDGAWNYSPENGLTPNFSNAGDWNINVNEMTTHRFINKIPVCGSSGNYFRMVSNEAFLLPPNYFLRIKAFNNSNTVWNASVVVTCFRERTYQP